MPWGSKNCLVFSYHVCVTQFYLKKYRENKDCVEKGGGGEEKL